MENNTLKEELEKLENVPMLDKGFQSKKLMMWFVRTSIAVLLYFLLWDYEWVRWTLYVYVPLALLSLLMILLGPYFLQKKLNRTKEKLDELDNLGDYDE